MINFLFALWIVAMPIVFSFSDLIGGSELILGQNLVIGLQLIIIGIIYSIYLLFKTLINFDLKSIWNKLKQLIKKPLFIVVLILAISMIISTLINGVKAYTLIYYSYFIVFYIIYHLDKNQLKKVLCVFLIVNAITCVMGFIDPANDFMPGFYDNSYPLSNQYRNPNYTGYVLAICMILVVLNLLKAKDWKIYVFNGLLFSIFSIAIFMNGSFSPITSVFAVLIVYMIYLWIKDKKFPLKLLIILLCFSGFAFIVDLIPNINSYRTCGYNYFLECIAVFDNIFDTNILSLFNIETIAGADGWDRDELRVKALSALNPLNGNILPFIFGYGAAFFSSIGPHLIYIGLTLDYGIITTITYILMLIYFLINIFKCKKNEIVITVILTFAVFIFNSFFCDIMDDWYWLFVCVIAVGFKLIKLQKLEINNKKHSIDKDLKEYEVK